MTLLKTEILNDVEYPSVELWMDKRESFASGDFYKYYLEHSEFKMSKQEWTEMLHVYSNNLFNYLAGGGVFLLPFYLGELFMTKIKVNGRQINWNESKKKYTEVTGKKWVKGEDLTDYYVYHNTGATIKDTFIVDWDKRGANCQHLRYWTMTISSRHQWKRLLKKFTDEPGLLQRLHSRRYTYRQHDKNR